MLKYTVSEAEAALVSEIDEICYGEILSVLAPKQAPDRDFIGTDRQINFLKALRREGKLDKVTIHDGEPTAAEIRGTSKNGFNFVRKLKF